MFGKRQNVALSKPKKLHSLEYLKYLYSVIQKNPTVTEQNSETIVEVVRLVAEILIWGDQNDSTVMDFFLEKNVLEYFLKYVKQNPARKVCIQLLQTLNILFENITNKTAIYYLLSNNHTNEIIAHRFDFADEEIVAYYISFLKTLSLRLNANTINFFYLEVCISVNSCPTLINQVILPSGKYGSHRCAYDYIEHSSRWVFRYGFVTSLYVVKDEGSLEFIHHQTSLPYFSCLVWSLGNTILDIDALLRSDMSIHYRTRLDDLVAEHVDLLHYVNDLLSLNIEGLNEVLCDQLLHRLLIPLHIFSLTQRHRTYDTEGKRIRRPHVSHPVSSLMLTHVYIILNHQDVLRVLTEAIFLGDPSLTDLLPNTRISKNKSGVGDLEKPCQSSPPASQLFDSNQSDESLDDESSDNSVQPAPAIQIARSLVAATKAVRAARNSAAGSRLSAYMANTQELHRHPSFAQPTQSLEMGLKYAKGVTPELLKSLWPSDLAPLRLSERGASVTEPLPIVAKNTDANASGVTNEPEQLSVSSIEDSSTGDSSQQSHFPSMVDDQGQKRNQLLLSTSSTPSFHLGPPVHSTPVPCTVSQDVHSVSETSFSLNGRPFLRSLFRALEVGPGTDYETLFALLLFSSIRANSGIDVPTLQLACLSDPSLDNGYRYDNLLIERLLGLISDACKANSRVRLITLYMAIRLLTDLCCTEVNGCILSDGHFAQLLSVREEATMVLRSYFRNDAIFLDLFEYELRQMQKPPLSFNKLAMDSSLLIPPLAASVLPGVSPPNVTIRLGHWRHLPRVEMEHTQRAIGAYLLIYIWVESLLRARSSDDGHPHTHLGTTKLTNSECILSSNRLAVDLASMPGLAGLGNITDPKASSCVHKAGDKLDLSSEALIGCTVEAGGSHEKRFLVNYSQQLVLVEPDSRQMGWGVITFIGPLQDLEAVCDPADSRCLHVTVHSPGHLTSTSLTGAKSMPTKTKVETSGVDSSPRHTFKKSALFVARFLFEDHIRCMTARQMLVRGCELARQTRLRKIAALLDFSPQFLRETFVFGGPTGGFNFGPSKAANHPSVAPNSASFPTTSDARTNSQQSTNPSSDKALNRDPGTFLLERQSHRTKSNIRSHPEDDNSLDYRIPLVSLAAMSKPSVPPPIPPHRRSVPLERGSAVPVRTRLIDSVNRTPVALVQQQLPTQPHSPVFTMIAPGESKLTEPVHRTPYRPRDSTSPVLSQTTPVHKNNSENNREYT
ncbi:hypothetical protein T265_04431 [Opisthorchis viverrini]|uniref:Uncharacterized protein n=1 Tax=Opisthorchis viverrini TaxID=6198 RepID=A0A075AGK9_OPIVI|nr:hypothetical protein T265_04431 [Opisthorchis viverrini]KER28824.1 hypothetical protein T265_04431 [Opisthorchis viverrini]